jgi:NTF2-related export protein 1/2
LNNAAAEQFVESYYSAVNSARHAIHAYYVPQSTLADGSSLPAIFLNGTEVADGSSVQRMFQQRYPTSFFEVDVVDCHILNDRYPAQSGTSTNATMPISLLVVVNGIFKQGSARDQLEQEFSETLVLVPNSDAPPRGQGGRFRKDYLIQSQTFRVVG